MKRRAKKFGMPQHTHFESGPNMTPLVDVVMVILIFLMLVGTFVAEKLLAQKSAVTPVASSASVAPDPTTMPEEPIFIRIEMATADRFIARIDRFQADTPDAVRDRLAGLLDSMKSIGRDVDSIAVVIAPASDVKYRFVIEVYDATLQAGFEKVSFATAN